MHETNSDWYGRLLAFLDDLEAIKIPWEILHLRPAIRLHIKVYPPKDRRKWTKGNPQAEPWMDIDFFPGGQIVTRHVGKRDLPIPVDLARAMTSLRGPATASAGTPPIRRVSAR